jgi:hypothetical protein
MQIKTSELTGPALDWAVAAALYEQYEEDRVVKVCRNEPTTPAWVEVENSPGSAPHFHRFSPSTNWAHGGPIIERGLLVLYPDPSDGWRARSYMDLTYYKGPTPLIAAMRAYVASQLGDEVYVPEELL